MDCIPSRPLVMDRSYLRETVIVRNWNYRRKASCFDDLPDEVLLDIFGNLNTFDLYKYRVCCKKWNRLMRDKSLYKRITMDESFVAIKDFSVLCARAYEFKHVIVNLDAFAEEKDFISRRMLIHFLLRAKNIEFLTVRIHFVLIYFQLLRLLCHLFLVKVKSFKLLIFGNPVFSKHWSNFMIKSYDRIEYCTHRNDVFPMKTLRVNELVLCNIHIDMTDIPSFCELNKHNLTEFDVTECKLHHMDQLLRALGECENLKSLSLGSKEFDDSAIDNGLEHLYNLKLEKFSISHVYFTSKCLTNFFRQMGRTLKSVKLNECKYADSSVLQEIAENCEHLETFVAHEYENSFEIDDIRTVAVNSLHLKVLRVVINKIGCRFLNLLNSNPLDLEEITCLFLYTPYQIQVLDELKTRMLNYKIQWIVDDSWLPLKALMFGIFKLDSENHVVQVKSFNEFQNVSVDRQCHLITRPTRTYSVLHAKQSP